MRNTILKTALLCTAFILCVASERNKDEDTKPQSTALLGYWKLKSGSSYAKKNDGTTITTATLKEGSFAHEFFVNGKYVGHDLTGSLPSETGTWKLSVKKMDGQDIKEGTLSITTPFTQASAGEFVIDADGSLKYEITSINAPANGSKPIITLTTKKYEGYPYAENWAVYVYQKQ